MKKDEDKKFCHPVQFYICGDLKDRLDALDGHKSDHLRTALRQYLENKEDPLIQVRKDKEKVKQMLGELDLKEIRILREREDQQKKQKEQNTEVLRKFEKLKDSYKRIVDNSNLNALISNEKRLELDSRHLGISKERLLELIHENFS